VAGLERLKDDESLVFPLGLRSHRYVCADGAPSALAASVAGLSPTEVMVVTDANVRRARGGYFQALSQRLEFRTIEIEPGESNKTLAAVTSIWSEILASADRKSVVVALGGGIVGDLAGFAAATALRGIRFVQAPTTLLAMVDASIGGKTGFDHAAGKNRIGAFHQPSMIFADLAHLETLTERELRAGLAEVVKMAVAIDGELFSALEKPALDRHAVVLGSAAAKIRVVKDDEREETGLRALLNFGHTVGHAIEVAGNYTDFLHGEAVAMGMMAELEATHRLGFTPGPVVSDVRALLERLGLPTKNPAKIERFLRADKKRIQNEILFPVVRGIGEASVERIPLETLMKALGE